MSTTLLWTDADRARRTHDADMRENTRFPSEIRRPDLLLHQVRERHPFDRPETLLVRVEGPYDQQRLWSWDEREMWLGLRYGSNLCDVLQGDVLTMTARGWISHLDGLHGAEPRAAWAALPTAKATS